MTFHPNFSRVAKDVNSGPLLHMSISFGPRTLIFVTNGGDYGDDTYQEP